MPDKIVVFDVETSIKNNGSPYDKANSVYYWGYYSGADPTINSYPDRYALTEADLVVGANLKFDLAWCKRYGIDVSKLTLHDVQLAHFVLSGQTDSYPSLAGMCEHYGIPGKLDIVALEYWDRSCSCYVSPVEKILSIMQKDFADAATIESMRGAEGKFVMLKSVLGEQLIQNAIKLLLTGDIRNYLIVLKQRLSTDEQCSKMNTSYQTVSMIDLWLKKVALSVEELTRYVSTTTTVQEKLGIDCVVAVMELWDILRKQSGWSRHTSTCNATPVDTPEIPREIMEEYLAQDLRATYQVYLKQMEEFEQNPQLYKLFQLQCEDLLTLLEMEYNGIVVDVATCLAKEKECEKKVQEIEKELQELVGDVPINFSSNDHCSAMLYGGSIVHENRVPVGVYKTGAKVGQVRYKVVTYEFKLQGIVKPPKGSELKKEGYYSTDEGTLRSCGGSKSARRVIDLLLERSKLEKLRGTYYQGIPERISETNAGDGNLHGSFNQCVTRTGRLSSSKPNLQNFPPEMNRLLLSRYDNPS